MTSDDFYALMQRLRIRHDRKNNYLFLDHKDHTGGNIIAACVHYSRLVDKRVVVKKVHFYSRAPEMDEVRMYCLLCDIKVDGNSYIRDPSPLEKQHYARGRYRDNRTKSK